MPRIYDQAFFKDKIVPIGDANLSVGSSAVLYGLSVYTVFPILPTADGFAAFRLRDHFDRLINSAKIIGIDTFEADWNFEKFKQTIVDLVQANVPPISSPDSPTGSQTKERMFARATVHVDALVPGTKSRELPVTVSVFLYEAQAIIPQDGARLKVSPWRRVPDESIPSRAKVNGAYVNSVLAKQDAINSGYDDCIFLNGSGHVAELSAANIFIVRDGTLITPDVSSDILEGITRKTVIEIARDMGVSVIERAIDLTELYIADEVFACGTSSGIAFAKEVDGRIVGKTDARTVGEAGDQKNQIGPITARIKERLEKIFMNEDASSAEYLMSLVV